MVGTNYPEFTCASVHVVAHQCVNSTHVVLKEDSEVTGQSRFLEFMNRILCPEVINPQREISNLHDS